LASRGTISRTPERRETGGGERCVRCPGVKSVCSTATPFLKPRSVASPPEEAGDNTSSGKADVDVDAFGLATETAEDVASTSFLSFAAFTDALGLALALTDLDFFDPGVWVLDLEAVEVDVGDVIDASDDDLLRARDCSAVTATVSVCGTR
jgi:hypothetical protein